MLLTASEPCMVYHSRLHLLLCRTLAACFCCQQSLWCAGIAVSSPSTFTPAAPAALPTPVQLTCCTCLKPKMGLRHPPALTALLLVVAVVLLLLLHQQLLVLMFSQACLFPPNSYISSDPVCSLLDQACNVAHIQECWHTALWLVGLTQPCEAVIRHIHTSLHAATAQHSIACMPLRAVKHSLGRAAAAVLLWFESYCPMGTEAVVECDMPIVAGCTLHPDC